MCRGSSLVERRPEKAGVASSILAPGTTCSRHRFVPEEIYFAVSKISRFPILGDGLERECPEVFREHCFFTKEEDSVCLVMNRSTETRVNGLTKLLSPGQRHSCSSTPEQLGSASAFALNTLQPCRRSFVGKPIAPLVTAGAKEFAPNRGIELADSIQREGTR